MVTGDGTVTYTINATVQVGELTYATFEAALEAALEANPTNPEVCLLYTSRCV